MIAISYCKPRFPFLFLLFVAFFNSVEAQKLFKVDDHRNIVLTPPNKKIVANIDTKAQPDVDDEGRYYWFDNINIHETVGGYSGYVLDGKYEEFYYPGNSLLRKGQFSYGLKDGEWITWYENGQVKERCNWDHGYLTGERDTFNQQGMVLSTEHYRDGELHGKKTEFINNKEEITYYRYGKIYNKDEEKLKKGKAKEKKETKNGKEELTAKSKGKRQQQTKTVRMQKSNNNTSVAVHKKKGLWQSVKDIF